MEGDKNRLQHIDVVTDSMPSPRADGIEPPTGQNPTGEPGASILRPRRPWPALTGSAVNDGARGDDTDSTSTPPDIKRILQTYHDG